MGSLQLDCPLCCSETFSCHNSLKYHLLSIIDNLICSACGKRFEKIIDLAMHVGNECIEAENESSNEASSIQTDVANEQTKEANVDKVAELTMPLPLPVEIKQEVCDTNSNDNAFATVVSNSILAKALMKNAEDDAAKNVENKEIRPITVTVSIHEDPLEENEEEQTSEDDLYYCSSCDIKFTSIKKHLQKFHEGHEVFLQQEEKEGPAIESVCVIAEEDYVEDEDEDCDNDCAEIMDPIKTHEVLNTIREEECTDKDGRLYTRKVVKIEKFWDDKDTKGGTSHPMNSKEKIGRKAVMGNMKTDECIAENQNILEIYQCSKCGEKFGSLDSSVYNHKCCSESHLDANKHKQCKICKSSFSSAKFLTMHMKTHKSKRSAVSPDIDPNPPFVCEICNTEFPAYKSLRLHRRMHEPIKSKDIDPPVTYGVEGEQLVSENTPRKMFICEICNKPYDKEYEEAHKKFHSKEIDFNCDICNRKFYTQENLDMHMRAHSETKKFTCSYCKKGFLTNEKLIAHMSTNCEKRQYECQFCGRRFARPHEKVKHERIHTGEKPHVCEICGKAFRVSYCLTLHMRTHSGTRPYKCDHCGKRFKAHSVYNHHLLTHSEDRKYKCPYCPKTFKTGVQLAGHKNSHTKPFTCTECNRPFASLYAVRAHMETHQRQNNLKYRCWMCGASYARAFALRDHIRDQHSGEPQDNGETEAIILDNTTGSETIILENDEYPINENVCSETPILAEADESMLIDIGAETVDNIEMTAVQVTNHLQDNDT